MGFLQGRISHPVFMSETVMARHFYGADRSLLEPLFSVLDPIFGFQIFDASKMFCVIRC